MTDIKLIAFDADDTLWENEPFFTHAQDRFTNLLANYIEVENMHDRLYATEKKNLSIFGYGAKSFTLSMIETAIELSEGKITGKEIQQIIDFGKDLIQHPLEVLEGVEETLAALKGKYELMVLTKGDLFDQEAKLARSGLAAFFDHVEIVSEKDEATYQQIFNRYKVKAEDVLMIGNSLKSDILPMVALGAKAIHIPFHTTWVHELVDEKTLEGKEYHTVENIRNIISLINQ
ncbi:HAD family hydrolase [Limibacter armeniacum]|uniref:HAD family hydrolase n=1 Tax=Limibacter armeniacum TaxID=466084 RepID=UPI002FE6C116